MSSKKIYIYDYICVCTLPATNLRLENLPGNGSLMFFFQVETCRCHVNLFARVYMRETPKTRKPIMEEYTKKPKFKLVWFLGGFAAFETMRSSKKIQLKPVVKPRLGPGICNITIFQVATTFGGAGGRGIRYPWVEVTLSHLGKRNESSKVPLAPWGYLCQNNCSFGGVE